MNTPSFVRVLAHDLRWQIVQHLSMSDYRVHELVSLLAQPVNLVSYHLRLLRDDAVVTAHRSESDGRDIYYSLNIANLQTLYQQTGEALHMPCQQAKAMSVVPSMRVLYLCTANSARSQIAEGLLRHYGQGNIEVHSAGNAPAQLHPQAIAALHPHNIDISQHKAKSYETFVGQRFDYVITLCDRMRETCPHFEHARHQIHWSIADPLRAPTNQQSQVFADVVRELDTRIKYFLQYVVTNQNGADHQ